MHERCPVCGLKFEREPGYFLGAMYFSYLLSIPPGLVIVLLIWRISRWPFDLVMLCAFVAYLPFVPAVTKLELGLPVYVIWIFALAGMVGTIVCAVGALVRTPIPPRGGRPA